MALKNSSLATNYLILYNAVLTIGWGYIFFLTAQNSSYFSGLWDRVEIPLKFFQTAAVLEVVHAFIKIVPSNVALTSFQVLSRLFSVWGVLGLSPPSQLCIGLPLLLYAWTITEIIRYSYYVLHLVGSSALIQWFRYTFFIVLYPIGVTGELLCIYFALSYVNEHQIMTVQMPNSWNLTFNFQYFLVFTMLTYIPLFPQLYFHMLRQRQKVLGSSNVRANDVGEKLK